MVKDTKQKSSVIADENYSSFFTYFYESGDTRKAIPALKFFFSSADFEHAFSQGPKGPVPYFFFRLAQLHPDLWKGYSELFEQGSPEEHLFLLWIFALENGTETADFLESARPHLQTEDELRQLNTIS